MFYLCCTNFSGNKQYDTNKFHFEYIFNIQMSQYFKAINMTAYLMEHTKGASFSILLDLLCDVSV